MQEYFIFMWLSNYESVMVFLQYIFLYTLLSYNTLLFLSIDENMNHTWLIFILLLIIAAVVGAVLLNFFKIDLILAYRRLCGKDKSKYIFISTNQHGLHTTFVIYSIVQYRSHSDEFPKITKSSSLKLYIRSENVL